MYQHERTCNVHYVITEPLDENGQDASLRLQNLAEELRDVIEQRRLALCRRLAKDGYEFIESNTNEQAALDYISANEMLFLEDGRNADFLVME
jgi:16S rRNA C1402 (ribose-2'-O) methylase RsmI